MIVKFKSGDKLEVNESYGLRLIEQGKAEAVPCADKPVSKAPVAPAPKKGKAVGDA